MSSYRDRSCSDSKGEKMARHPRITPPGPGLSFFQREIRNRGITPGSPYEEPTPPQAKSVSDAQSVREPEPSLENKEVIQLIKAIHGDIFKRCLYVGGLPANWSVEKLEEVLPEARSVRFVEKSGRRCAVVEFCDPERIPDATSVLRKKEKSLSLIPCADVKLSYDGVEFQSRKLYIEGPLADMTPAQMQEILPGAAMISSVQRKTAQNQSYDIWFAIARFEDSASARVAFTKCQGIIVDSRPVLVSYCTKESADCSAEPPLKRFRKDSESDAVVHLLKQEFVINSEYNGDLLSGLLDDLTPKERRKLIAHSNREADLSDSSSSSSSDSDYE